MRWLWLTLVVVAVAALFGWRHIENERRSEALRQSTRELKSGFLAEAKLLCDERGDGMPCIEEQADAIDEVMALILRDDVARSRMARCSLGTRDATVFLRCIEQRSP